MDLKKIVGKIKKKSFKNLCTNFRTCDMIYIGQKRTNQFNILIVQRNEVISDEA